MSDEYKVLFLDLLRSTLDPRQLAEWLPRAIGHREQELIAKIQRLELRNRCWKALAKRQFKTATFGGMHDAEWHLEEDEKGF